MRGAPYHLICRQKSLEQHTYTEVEHRGVVLLGEEVFGKCLRIEFSAAKDAIGEL